MKKAQSPLLISNTSIRPDALKLAKLAAVYSGESITSFLSQAAQDRAVRVLKANKAQIPPGLVMER